MHPLTDAQKRVLRYLTDCYTSGTPATIRQMVTHLGFRSNNSVMCHLRPLVAKGYVECDPTRSRSYRPRGLRLVPMFTDDDAGRNLERALEGVRV